MDFSLKSLSTASSRERNHANKDKSKQEMGESGSGGHLQSRWAAITKARQRVEALKNLIGPLDSLDILQESEWPAKLLLKDASIAQLITSRISSAKSGHGKDPLCQWLYDTFQTKDPDLQDVVLRYIPALCGIYLPRITTHGDDSLAGFEAVLLALYSSETKVRNGHPLTINIPDLSHPSLYHAPRIPSTITSEPPVGLISPSLEPQEAVKSTKRACIVGVALNLFLSRIAYMPPKAKIEACQSAFRWASFFSDEDGKGNGVKTHENGSEKRILDSSYHLGTSSSARSLPKIEIPEPGEVSAENITYLPHHEKVCESSHARNMSLKEASNEVLLVNKSSQTNQEKACESNHILYTSSTFMQASNSNSIYSSELNNADFARQLMQAGNGARIPLQWEFLQPTIRILGHCLMAPFNSEEVKGIASLALQALHHRASHDLIPEAILATRSLLRLDLASKTAISTLAISENSASRSSKPRKPKNLLVLK